MMMMSDRFKMLIPLDYINKVRSYIASMEYNEIVQVSSICKEETRDQFRHALAYIIDGREMWDAGYDLMISDGWETIRKVKIKQLEK